MSPSWPNKNDAILHTILALVVNWAILGHEIYSFFEQGLHFWYQWKRSMLFILFLVFNILFLVGIFLKSHKFLLPLVYLHTNFAILIFIFAASFLVFSIGMLMHRAAHPDDGNLSYEEIVTDLIHSIVLLIFSGHLGATSHCLKVFKDGIKEGNEAKMMKRNDLQSIRGVAIFLVLIFHIQPSLFPLGFIGVDMFFVLSGFLMSMILSRSSLSAASLKEFYTRRFKRIIPLLYFVLVNVYIGCAFLIFGQDKDQLKVDLRWSLAFISNIQPLSEELGYWDQVVSYRFLVHCWSLGVEIQFYVIAPFIIFGSNQLTPLKRNGVLLFLIFCSLAFQLLTPPKVSYGLLPSRIWQFLLGALCFELKAPPEMEKCPEEKNGLLPCTIFTDSRPIEDKPKQNHNLTIFNKISEFLMVLVCLAVLLDKKKMIGESEMRIFGTAVTALMIRFPQHPRVSLASNNTLIYLGDISYVMYLIHWPLIVSVRYLSDSTTLSLNTSLFLFAVIFIISIALHHSIENFLLKSSLLLASLLTLFCLTVILFSFPFYDKCCDFSQPVEHKGINVTEAIQYNQKESQKVYYPLPCSHDSVSAIWTNYTEGEHQLRCQAYGNESAKILVIGNSMAYRSFPLISKVLKGRYKELRLYSRSGRPPLSDVDPAFTNATHFLVNKMQPDIIWNIHSALGDYAAPFDEKNKTSDRAYLEFERNINYYKNRTKVFLIDLPFYWSNITVAYEMVKRLKMGRSLNDLKVEKQVMEKEQMYHRQRIKAVPCENCVYLDVESQMLEGNYYWLYNRKNYHTYSKDGSHFTWEMLDRIEPLYKQAIEDALKKLNS